MQIDNLTARVAACMCLVLLSITTGIAFYELAVDWENISSLFLGLYLYSAYVLIGIIMDKPKGRLLNHRHKFASRTIPSIKRYQGNEI